MTDTAVLAAISALSKKVDGIGGNEVLDLDVTYTTVDKSEGIVSQNYQAFTGVLNESASVSIGNDYYYFGGDDGTTVSNIAVKFNTVTGKYTQISSVPINITAATAVVVNGKIAVLGGRQSTSSGSNIQTSAVVYDPETDTWATHTNLPYGSIPASAVSYGNMVYIYGADEGTAMDYWHYRDFSSTGNNWSSNSSGVGNARYGVSVAIGSTAYVFSGYDTSVYSMDMGSRAVTTKAAGPVAMRMAKAVVVGTKVYLMQPTGSSTYYTYNYVYDTVANTWTQLAAIPISTTYSQTVTNGTSKIWLVGGSSSNGNKIYEYDIAGNTWTAKTNAPFSIPISSLGQNTIYYDAGYVYVPGNSAGSMMKFDTVANTWSTPFITMAATNPAVVGVGSKIYAFGGIVGSTYQNTTMVYDTLTRTWELKTPMARTRQGANAIHLNGKIYVIAGANSSSLANVDIYDIATDSWTTGANTPVTGGVGFTATLAGNGKIYGTYSIAALYEYDPAANTWTTKATNPVGRNGTTQTPVGIGNKVYVTSSSVGYDVYDIDTNTWSVGSSTSSGYYGVGFEYNGKAYIYYKSSDRIGVLTPGGSLGHVTYTDYNNKGLYYIRTAALVGSKFYFVGPHGLRPMATYDIDEAYWNSVAPRGGTALSQFATAVKGGNLYVVGGSANSSYSSGTSSIYRYDAKQNYWYSFASMPSGVRVTPAAAIWNDSLYVFGGENSSGTDSAVVEEFNLNSGLVTTKAPMSAATQYVYAATCGDYIWVLRDSNSYLWRYDPKTDSWLQASSISQFYYNNAGMVSDGEFLYFFGGYSGNELRVMRFNPDTYVWSTLRSMPHEHTNGSSTYVDGKIYVSGGSSSSIDVYDISTGYWSTLPDTPIYSNRAEGGLEFIDGKIVMLGGYPYSNSTTLFDSMGVEALAIPYREVDSLDINEAGIYHSLTPDLTLRNENSGREGDTVAAAPLHDIYPVGKSVDKRQATSIEVLKT